MYDYVIAGAGSAACVLAARLSEDPGTRVLLLEAGPPDDAPELAMPGATMSLWGGPLAWPDATVSQRHAAGRRVGWPHGRTIARRVRAPRDRRPTPTCGRPPSGRTSPSRPARSPAGW